MDLREGTYILQKFENLPASAAEFRRRHELARHGVLAMASHLASGSPEVVTPFDLVRLFVVSDLFVFDSAYRTAFYNTRRVEFSWRRVLEGNTDFVLDMQYEPGERWREDRPPRVMEWVPEMAAFEIVVNPRAVAANESVPLPTSLRGEARCDLLDRLPWGMCRMMLMAAGTNCFIDDEDLGRMVGVDLIRLMRFDGTKPSTISTPLGI